MLPLVSREQVTTNHGSKTRMPLWVDAINPVAHTAYHQASHQKAQFELHLNLWSTV